MFERGKRMGMALSCCRCVLDGRLYKEKVGCTYRVCFSIAWRLKCR